MFPTHAYALEEYYANTFPGRMGGNTTFYLATKTNAKAFHQQSTHIFDG